MPNTLKYIDAENKGPELLPLNDEPYSLFTAQEQKQRLETAPVVYQPLGKDKLGRPDRDGCKNRGVEKCTGQRNVS